MDLADDLARHNADLRRSELERARHDLLHVGPPPSEAGQVLPSVPQRQEVGRDRGSGPGRKAGEGMTATRVRLASGVEVTTERPVVDLADYQQEGRAAGFRFQCPKCGNVATPQDFTVLGADPQRAAQECIGRARLDIGRDACDWAAFGLLGTMGRGVLVRFPDGRVVESFPFAAAS